MRHIAIAIALLTLTTGCALALDADDLARKVQATALVGGDLLTYETARSVGDDIVFSEVRWGYPTDPDPLPLIGEVVAEGVTADGSGGYHIAQIRFPAFVADANGFVARIENLALGDVHVGSRPDADPVAAYRFYGLMSAGPIGVELAGIPVLHADAAKQTSSYDRATGIVASSLTVEGAILTLGPALAEAGVPFADMLAGDVSFPFAIRERERWMVDDQRLEVDSALLDLEDIGRFELSAGLTGFGRPQVANLARLYDLARDARPAAGASQDVPTAYDDLSMAETGAYASISLSGARLRFTDRQGVNRLLDYLAAQGIDRDSAIAGAAGLAVAFPPDLSDLAAEAIRSFMKNPGTLELTARPLAPVRFGDLTGYLHDPTEAARQLGLGIRSMP